MNSGEREGHTYSKQDLFYEPHGKDSACYKFYEVIYAPESAQNAFALLKSSEIFFCLSFIFFILIFTNHTLFEADSRACVVQQASV